MSKKIDPRLAQIGARIAAARKALHLKQSDLAGHLRVTVGAVGQWERGYVMPTMANLDELTTYLKTSRQYLLTGSEEDKSGVAQDVMELEMLRLFRRLSITDRARGLISLAEQAGTKVQINEPKTKK